MPAPWTALLSVEGPDGLRTTYPFRHPRVVVGRKRHNDLTLPDQGISASHCEFVAENDAFLVRDLGSVNGTFVNDKRVRERRLRDGDVVRVGDTTIAVTLQGAQPRPATRFWPALALLAALGLAVGVFAWHEARLASQARAQFVAAAREALQADPCAANGAPLDAETRGRSVVLAAHLSAAERAQNGALVDAWHRQAAGLDGVATSIAAVVTEQRQAVERATRLGARLRTEHDRKLSFWATQSLHERAARAEAFADGVRALQAETARFASLLEAAVVHGDTAHRAELGAFRFTTSLEALQKACAADASRTGGATLSALNAFEE